MSEASSHAERMHRLRESAVGSQLLSAPPNVDFDPVRERLLAGRTPVPGEGGASGRNPDDPGAVLPRVQANDGIPTGWW